jgi:MFS family permease
VDLGLTLTETNAIWGGAVFGQYVSSAFMGSISDNYGPKPLSLLAAVLFGAGYFLMAKTEQGAMLSNASTSEVQSHTTAFVGMAIFFVLVGAGVAAR